MGSDRAPEKSRLHRAFYRNGPSHRDGADVTFADIVKFFNFRTAVIGNWVTDREQQLAANLFFDALCDLMDILQVPPQVVSLNGTLSLAFGKGGRKGSSAHYDTRQRQLALAKNAGGGALAHEWFHGFDHYIHDKLFPNLGMQGFASASWLKGEFVDEHPLNLRLDEFFRNLFLDESGTRPSGFVTRAVEVDKANGGYYFAMPQELAARVFEALIQRHSTKNHFLASGTKQSAEAVLGLYPDDNLAALLKPSLFEYFSLLGQALAQR